MKTILIIDDDDEIRDDLSEVLASKGYLVDAVCCGLDAIRKVKERFFDIALLDMVMPKGSGIDTVVELKNITPKTKIIMITAFASIKSAVEAIKKGASEYISKPFKVGELLEVIGRVIEEANFEEDVRHLNVEHILSSLANPIRRDILKLFYSKQKMRFMEILTAIGMKQEHQKIVFHLRILRQSNIIEQDDEKLYFITKEGKKTLDLLHILEKFLLNNR
ncbi:MAG: response regulator [Candidatus Magnetoovum sp. WYHC-5]|nr:response regulator [Candidatus Magnetoovum sp. WYHC-5]